MRKLNKKIGNTEVCPFLYMEDIKSMMDYFQSKEMWHSYLAFNLGLLLGIRVDDILSLTWSDFFLEDGRMIDKININEQKTGKETYLHMCGACKNALQLYIINTGICPMEHFNEFILPSKQKIELLRNEEKYSAEEYKKLMWNAIQSQSAELRKQFTIAVDVCDIQYHVNMHSLRKSFLIWSYILHPYDVTTIDKLQGVFTHSDKNTIFN